MLLNYYHPLIILPINENAIFEFKLQHTGFLPLSSTVVKMCLRIAREPKSFFLTPSVSFASPAKQKNNQNDYYPMLAGFFSFFSGGEKCVIMSKKALLNFNDSSWRCRWLLRFALHNLAVNRIYNKILYRDWLSAPYISGNRREITWVSNYRFLMWSFWNWIPTWLARQLRSL